MSDLDIKCKWHKCLNTFVPEHGNQQYCCKSCRVKRLEWSKARGARIVNRILDCPPKQLHAVAFDEQQKLLEEINGYAPY